MPNPQPLEALQEAWKSPDIGKRGRGKLTLLKEAAKERYVERLSQEFEAIGEVQIQEAKKPRNVTERIHVTKVILGENEESKAEQHLHLHKHEASGELSEAARKLIEEYEQKLKELKTT